MGDADGTPLDETGVIATQSKVLAAANLSILYLSTFFSDYTLVQLDDVPAAAEAFKRGGFELHERGPPPGADAEAPDGPAQPQEHPR